jgi:hypothetical protein
MSLLTPAASAPSAAPVEHASSQWDMRRWRRCGQNRSAQKIFWCMFSEFEARRCSPWPLDTRGALNVPRAYERCKEIRPSGGRATISKRGANIWMHSHSRYWPSQFRSRDAPFQDMGKGTYGRAIPRRMRDSLCHSCFSRSIRLFQSATLVKPLFSAAHSYMYHIHALLRLA